MHLKRLLIVGIVSIISMMSISASDFTKKTSYENNFSDVPADEWYASSVEDAYEFGIMNGVSDTIFSPEGTLTVAEGITIASRIHAVSNGNEIPSADGEWYQMYVNYAIENGIMTEDQFDGYDVNIKRFEIAELFAAAYDNLPVINNIEQIPDVASGVDYFDAILKMYGAGILTGNDSYGTFAPNSYLKRCEISAMAVRIADSSQRVKKDFDKINARAFTDAYYIIENPNTAMGGWNYDNRFDLLNYTGQVKNVLTDASDEHFFAFKRNFEAEYEGILRLEIAGNYKSSENGVYIAFENADEDRIVEITVNDGEWVLNGIDSVSTGVEVSADVSKFYTFVLEVDLDVNTASVIVNNMQSEKIDIKPDAVLERLVIGTNKVGSGYIQKDYVRLSKNYVLDENFLGGNSEAGQKATSWDIAGDFVLSGMPNSVVGRDIFSLKAESLAGSVSYAKKNYTPVSGTIALEAYVLLPEKTDGASVSFTSDGEDIFKFETKNNGKFYMGEIELHEYIPNVWQWLYVEANTLTGTATVKINGKKRADVSFDAKFFDGIDIRFTPETDGVMWVDDLEVYPLIEHADYPSYPQVAESTDYNIGMNMCYLWRDTQSTEGWDAMSAFEEFDNPLGFYDEGLRETADWELKLLAEHGIDFIHVCWYAPSYNTYNQNVPIKKMRFSYSALHDGYMNAKYSDLVDFCIMWENSWTDVSSLDQFKEYIWNYWKEHYFSDDRYLRLDNKAVITVWEISRMTAAFGGNTDGLKAAIEFMNEDIKSLGYDGIIILSRVADKTDVGTYQAFDSWGIDATYAYSWGTPGSSAEHQIACNEANATASKEFSHHVPTISNGYNMIGRGNVRYPVISGEDHLKVAENIKEILSTYNTGTWKDNTLMVSTWNEYSEGTYAMPTKGTGFDYLENIRKVFTNDTSDHLTADKPLTETQLKRISHMYPENRSPIRRLHLEKSEAESFVVTPDMLESVRTYDMSQGDGDRWTISHGLEEFSTNNGVIYGKSSGGDFGIVTSAAEFAPINAEEIPYIHIRMKVSKKSMTEMFFMTNDVSGFNGQMRATFEHEKAGEFCDYYINMTAYDTWADKITAIRIDPMVTDGEFEISLIELLNFKPVEDTTPKVVVNGTQLEFIFEPALLSDGDFAVAADPSTGFFSALMVYYEYDRFTENGVLTVKTKDERTLVFKIGSDKVIVDGEEQELGYTMELRDGLPVFHVKKFAELLGYSVSVDGIVMTIMSCTDEEYEKILKRKTANSWEFDFAGDVEGWSPQLCVLDTGGDSKLTVSPYGADVTIYQLVKFDAADYTHIVMGVEYTKELETQSPQLFFTTSNNGNYTWSADRCINAEYKTDGKKYGDTIEAVFKLEDDSDFAGTITGLRFDPVSDVIPIKIDYIRLIYDDSIDYTELMSENLPSWEFNEDTNVEGWLGASCNIGTYDGYLIGSCTGPDINIVKPGLSINSADAQVLIMGVKYNPDYCHAGAALYFITDKSFSYTADKCITAPYILPKDVKEGDIVEVKFDFTKNSYFKSNITGLRIDIHGGDFPFEVDYIRWYKKDGYVPPEDHTLLNDITMPTSVTITDASQIPDGIKVASGGAGKLEIVDDPENEGTKVFKIACVVPGDYYTYFDLFMNFEASKTYSISYKVYPLTNMLGKDYTTSIGSNIRYGWDGKNITDHVVENVPDKTSGSGWVSVERALTIDADYNPTENDCFQLFARAFGGAGVEFLVKDIVIMPAN